LKQKKTREEILKNDYTKAVWYIAATQVIEKKISKKLPESETRNILQWIMDNKDYYSEGYYKSVFQIKFIKQLYTLTLGLFEENKKKHLDVQNEDNFMKELSYYLISIVSLPVQISNMKKIYEISDNKLLDALAHDDKNACSEFQKEIVADVYVSPLIKLTDLVNQRIDIKLEDQKYSQTLYVIVLTFLEDITRYYRAHGSDLNEKQKLIMCEKIEYIINTICEKVKKKSPTRTLCEKALQIIKNFQEIDIKNSEDMIDAVELFEDLLREKMEKNYEMEYDYPDYSFRIPNVSPVTKLLSSKLKKSNVKNIEIPKKDEHSKEKTFSELRYSRLTDYDGNNNLVCYIEQIWVQVELETESVILEDVTYPDLSNYFCSPEFGVFKMTLKHISWYGIKNQSVNRKFEEAIRIDYNEINCYSYGFIKSEKGKNEEKEQYGYIMVCLKQEVFKFYPFKIYELQLLLTALYSLTGIIPISQEQQVKTILMKKIENVRREVLLYLVRQESPWITTSDELYKSLNRMTHETKPQRILEIERLFHSCRMESEVTKETIYYIRKKWHETYSERVRVKILVILDRLIDRTVLNQSDPNFALILKWLEYLEESLHPIKNFEVLNLIQTLIKRAKMIRIKTLTPLSVNSLTTSFDNYDEFLANLLYTEHIKEI